MDTSEKGELGAVEFPENGAYSQQKVRIANDDEHVEMPIDPDEGLSEEERAELVCSAYSFLLDNIDE